LIIHQILIGWLSLSKCNFLTNISFLFFNFFLFFSSDLFHSFLSFNLSHSVISEFLTLTQLLFLLLVFIDILLLNFFEFLSSLHSCSSQLFFLFDILFIVNTSLYFSSLF
jgi:hypothetical protein